MPSDTPTEPQLPPFADEFVRALPGDAGPARTPRAVMGAMYAHVAPDPVVAPRLLSHEPALAEALRLQALMVDPARAAQVLAGNALLPGMVPYAAAYGGHQFGHWAGQLGDGRAITLGELRDRDGGRQELQLKGAGRTPFSRGADGRAVLRSSVREYLMSEAMHHLGVPTTRALSLVATGEDVVRDMFYDGRPQAEPGAIVCRVAPTFLRFGNFELFASRGDEDNLRALAEFTLRSFYPELGEPSPEVYFAWLQEIGRRSAEMVAHWMRVGFVHGVMNTDNMSILGLTIDYGPYGWIDDYDPAWTPNTTDAQGRRYRFGNQPEVALWNVSRLAGAFVPLLGSKERAEEALAGFIERFETVQSEMQRGKLGLHAERGADDHALLVGLYDHLGRHGVDMTLFFRKLAAVHEGAWPDAEAAWALLSDAYYDDPGEDGRQALSRWLQRYRARAEEDGSTPQARASRMRRHNPKYVLRNYMAQQAIDAAERGDLEELHTLQALLRHPYDEQPEHEARYFVRRPDWAKNRAGCSMLSCSS